MYTTQGEYVCAGAQRTIPAGKRKPVEAYVGDMDPGPVRIVGIRSAMTCPTNPFERPNCTTDCSTLVKNSGCSHIDQKTDDAQYRNCSMCMQKCCREEGVPTHTLFTGMLTNKPHLRV
jgi:hypothetical protein